MQIGPLNIDPPVLSAPMAGYSDFAYREMLRRLGGVGLIATEMVSARSFVYLENQGDEHPGRLWGVRDEPRPLAVQIWDNEPATLIRLARALAETYAVSLIDLNFGCPAKQIAGRSASGSALLRDPGLVGRIVGAVVRAAAPVPVTAKIRLGLHPESINASIVARAVEEAGAAALTVHGRSASQMYRGDANWEEIARVKEHLVRIPLIGNGDIRSVGDALHRLRDFPVDAIMIGRAGLDRPWLFHRIAQALREEQVDPEPGYLEQRRLLLEHYQLLADRFGPTRAVVLIRKFAHHYSLGKPGARNFRVAVGRIDTRDAFLRAVDSLFTENESGYNR